MNLSSELISQFVKITKDDKKVDNGSTMYGTIVEYDGQRCVKLDGSDQITPITTTADVLPGDRVSVLIKNHTATVTGNATSPSARKESVDGLGKDVKEMGSKITEFELVVADMVTVEQLNATQANIELVLAEKIGTAELEAQKAEIDTLLAKKADIEELNAAKADIDELTANMLTVDVADAKYATIANLDATNATVNNLNAAFADLEEATVNKLAVQDGYIEDLRSDVAEIDTLYAKTADVEELYAKKADVELLEADVADIDTLIFGSASGTTIQTSFANAVIAQLGDAQIKSAMIDHISADKINAGDINTNNVRVVSEDGRLVISDETIQISDATRVRVQIGKDAAGDYSISIWDADGNLMFSEGGITDSAIKDAIIRNDMVANDANIAASKLDISSLFTEINNSTETINAGRVTIDTEGQTLDVAFTSMSSELDSLDETVSSQGTQLSVIQGQISSKIWQQDIEAATDELGNEVDNLSTKQSSLEQTIDSVSATVSQHTSQIANKADSSAVTEISDKVTELEADIDGFRSTVSETYATKTQLASTDAKVNEATEAAVAAQNTANTAKANAETAQKKANDAATAAANAQQAADDADAKAAQAAADLATAQQNLASVTSRVDATEDEVAAAQEAVKTAQAAADKAKSDAAAAQSTADTAKVNAATAQTAANTAKTAADNAQAAADEAQQAADDAQAAVDALAVRVTTAETKITQNSEQISLMATKKEVTETLGGYYTKEETDAALVVKADEISSTVESKINSLEIGGRNLLRFTQDLLSIPDEARSSDGISLYNTSYGALTPTEDGLKLTFAGNGQFGITIPLAYDGCIENGETVTLTFKYRGNITSPGLLYFLQRTSPNISVDLSNYSMLTANETDWQQFEATFYSNYANERVNYQLLLFYGLADYTADNWIEIKAGTLQLEKGNKATDWTPAPEDVDEKIDEGDSDVLETTKERITTAVQTSKEYTITALESYTTTESFNQLTDDVNKRTTEIESQLSVLSDSINMEFTSVRQDLQALTEISKRIKFDDNGITMSSGDSSTTLQLDNEEGVVIKQNGTVQSRLVNNEFKTGNILVEVDKYAQFGGLRATPLEDQNGTKKSLMWVKVGG